jgi:hypothetical protein
MEKNTYATPKVFKPASNMKYVIFEKIGGRWEWMC